MQQRKISKTRIEFGLSWLTKRTVLNSIKDVIWLAYLSVDQNISQILGNEFATAAGNESVKLG